MASDKQNYDVEVSDIKHRYRNSEINPVVYIPSKGLWLDKYQYFNDYIFGYSIRNNKVIV